MRTDLVRNGFGAAGIARRGRKVRTSDCRKCFLLQSFRNAGLPATTIHALCEQMWLNRVHRRQILYVDGNRATHLYAIRSGKVKLVRPVASGREHVTAVLETGDLFGFEAIFDSAYATGAVALTDCELCLASGAELSDVMSEVPRLATDLARYLHHQLCRTRERQACLGASGASAKLASFFLHGLSSYGGNSGRDFTVAGGIIEILPSVYRCGTCSPSSGWLHTEVLTSIRAAHGARSMREHHAPLILPGLSIVLGISHRGQPPNDSARGAHMKRARRAHPAAILGAAVWLASGCRSADQDSPTPSASPPSSFAAEEGLHFADVTREAEIDFVHSIGDGHLSNLVESSGGGVAFLDYDQDGYLDLYMANGAFVEGVSEGPKPRRPLTNRLYRNRGNGTFEEVTDRAGVGHSGYGMGVVVADYDNDGYPDLYLSNHGPNVLYHNNGNGTFSDVTGRAGVGGSGSSVGAVWLDYDNDGLLDLYVGNYIQFDPEYDYYYAPDGFPGPLAYAGQADVLYRNRGDGTFEDVTESMGVLRPEGRAMGVSAADYDDDGYVDIYVANDAMANFLFHNEKGQRFQELALPAGVAYNHGGDATSSMAVDFADYDGDGLMDLFVSDMSYSALYRNEGNGLFRDVTYQAGIAVASGQYVGWASAFIDYDNDGDVDIFKVNGDLQHLFGQEDQLFENLEGRRFRDVSVERGSYFREALVGRGAAFGDYDNDGDIDVFIVNLNDRGVLLRNEGGNKNNWLLIRLVGRSSNRDGVGARLRVVSGDMVQVAQKKNSTGYLSQNDPRLHFGLGENEIVDRIEIVWPSGIVQVLENVRARQILTISEPQRVGS